MPPVNTVLQQLSGALRIWAEDLQRNLSFCILLAMSTTIQIHPYHERDCDIDPCPIDELVETRNDLRISRRR